jgi:PAS domain S-box-containing protein
MKSPNPEKSRFSFAGIIKNRSLPRVLFLYLLIVTAITVLALAHLWSSQAYKKSGLESDKLRDEYIGNQKARVMQQVIGVRDYIYYVRSNARSEMRNILQNRVNEAYNIAMNIYLENKGKRTDDEIKAFIRQALSPVWFNNNRCCYHIYSMDGVQQINPISQVIIGKNTPGNQSKQGNNLVSHELNFLRNKNQGFVYCRQDYGLSDDSTLSKISYVKKFDPFNWYIGTFDYVADFESDIKHETLERISRIRYEREGYVFVNTYDGKALITNGVLKDPPVDILASNDENWKKIFAVELEAANKPDGDFYTYKFRKLSEPKSSTKVSYFTGVPEWKWIIGAGIYIDEIEPIIAKKKADLDRQIRLDIIKVFCLMLIIMIIIVIVARYISKRTRESLDHLTHFFDEAKTGYQAIDPKLLFFDEFQSIASSADSMVAERQKVKIDLETEKSLLRCLIDSVPDLIFFKDKDGKFLGCNKAFESYTGRTEADFKGKTDYDFFTKEQADEYAKSDADILRSKQPSRNHEWSTFPGGRKVLYDTMKTIFFDTKGNPLGLIGISRDITEIEETQNKLTAAKEKAEEADKLKTAFLANMSHEIRTPMNAIIGFSDLLTDDDLTRNEKLDYSVHIKKAGESLMNLISDIIDIAKIEAGQLQINNAACDLDDLLNELVGTYSEVISKAGKDNLKIRLFKQVGVNGLAMMTDPFRLKQVLSNLIGNATKFTDRGHIEFGYLLKDTETIEFIVRDTGMGIPIAKQKDIFHRFSQVDNSNTRKYGGTGLGLAISKNIVEIMGGKIWLESEPDKGSSFCFTLPFNPVYSAEIPEISQDKTVQQHDWHGKTILVAEDVPSNFMFIEAALRRTNVRLLWAQDGKQAVAMALENASIDLILMDIQLPELNGYEATAEILKLRPELPVISQTAYALSGEKEKSLSAGCVDYIPKPIKSENLISIIGKYLFKKEQSR